MPVLFSSADLVSFAPSICSDLFFGTVPENLKNAELWVVMVKDSWFSCLYMKNLMKLYAITKAIETKKDLLYVGYFECVWVGKKGKQVII